MHSIIRGASISPGRLLRNLDGHGPVRVLGPVAARGLEIQLLQARRHRSHLAGPYGAVVYLDDGRYLEPRPRQEDLVGDVQLGSSYVALVDGHPEFLLGELHYRVARDAFEDVRRDGGRHEAALADQEDVRRARLGDEPALG